jgi:hypothetical protein
MTFCEQLLLLIVSEMKHAGGRTDPHKKGKAIPVTGREDP